MRLTITTTNIRILTDQRNNCLMGYFLSGCGQGMCLFHFTKSVLKQLSTGDIIRCL